MTTTTIGGNRGLRGAAALALTTAVAVLATGCGVVHVHFGASGGSAQPPIYGANPAYAQCMRSHGLPDFPAPGPWASITIPMTWLLTGTSPVVRANAACEHLMPPTAAAVP